jgi:transposase
MGLSYRRRRGDEKYGSPPTSRPGKPVTYHVSEAAPDLPGRRAYPSDLTDAQWALIEPLVPKCKSGGRPEAHSRRELVNAMLYVLHNGCTWRALPHDFPPWPTVYTYFRLWRMSGLWKTLNDHLRSRIRHDAGRATSPSAAIMDSQSARTTEKGGFAAGTATNT